MKPGWKTTEFWMTLLTQLVGLLVILGVISTQDRASIEGALSSAITAVVTLIAQVSVLWKYIQDRTQLKMEAMRYEDEASDGTKID